MLTFLFGWFVGIVSVAAAFDVRRALSSAQEREEAFQRHAERLESVIGSRHV